ncbi:MAG: hypothetical protein AAGI30_13730 [Planctomycetota bacterium]
MRDSRTVVVATAAGTVIACSGSAAAELVSGRFNATLGYVFPKAEIALDIPGTFAQPDFVFEFIANTNPERAEWSLGTFDIGANDANTFTTMAAGSFSDTDPQDDADFQFFRDGSGGVGPSGTEHFIAGDIFDPSGINNYNPTDLYNDKESENPSFPGGFDDAMMGGGAADGEIRYLGFAFSEPFQQRFDRADASTKLSGWIEVRYNVVEGPDPAITRDDSAITLLRYVYSTVPGDSLVVGEFPCLGDLDGDSSFDMDDVILAEMDVEALSTTLDFTFPNGVVDAFDLAAFFNEALETCE